jgi:hypothetical protein
MDVDLPYLVAPKRFPDLLAKLQTAAVPERVSFEFIKKLGFSSSNDRAFPSLLRRLGFLDQNGQPTARYRAFRQKDKAKRVLAEGVLEAFAPLFALHTDAHTEDREALKGLISRVTGRDQRIVDLIASTFEMLVKHADFTPAPEVTPKQAVKKLLDDKQEEKKPDRKSEKGVEETTERAARPIAFSYNIQIHLPATTEIAVYNAIFRSLKEHLGE